MWLGGDSGELRIGRQRVARVTSWDKAGRTLTFSIDPTSINAYWANYGPVTGLAIHMRTKTCVFSVEPSDFRVGTLLIALDEHGQPQPPRVEDR